MRIRYLTLLTVLNFIISPCCAILAQEKISRTTLVDPSQADWELVANPDTVHFLLVYDLPEFISNKRITLDAETVRNILRHFRNVKALYLLAPELSDELGDVLKESNSLEAIALVNVQLTSEGAQRLIEGMPKLKMLALWNTRLDDAGIEQLVKIREGLDVEQTNEGFSGKYFDVSGCATAHLMKTFDAVSIGD